MKRFIVLVFGILIIALAQGFGVLAQDPDVELVIDPECTKYLATKSPDDVVVCSTLCNKECVDQNLNCLSSDMYNCHNISFNTHYDDIPSRFLDSFNIFGLELCTDPEVIGRPVDDPYCTVVLVRMAFYAMFSLIIFATVIMALWGVWERSTAADSPEKIEKSVKIFRNAVVGVLISLAFLGIIQLVSVLLGLTGSIFDITIVPQPKVLKNGDVCSDVYGVCPPGTSCSERVPGSGIEYCH